VVSVGGLTSRPRACRCRYQPPLLFLVTEVSDRPDWRAHAAATCARNTTEPPRYRSPITIGLGMLLAFILPGVTSIWIAVLVGAVFAPTDAALGASMMVNPAVPARIRRIINVESGLNDGIATPVMMVAIADAGGCREGR